MVQEFSIEIPDKEADAIQSSMSRPTFCRFLVLTRCSSVNDAVEYILKQPDGKRCLPNLLMWHLLKESLSSLIVRREKKAEWLLVEILRIAEGGRQALLQVNRSRNDGLFLSILHSNTVYLFANIHAPDLVPGRGQQTQTCLGVTNVS